MRLFLLPSILFLVIAFTRGPPAALASSGDRSDEFQRCLDRCTRQACTADGRHVLATDPDSAPRPPLPLPLALRLTRWTCADDCKYACMHALTDLAAESGVPMQQFYGKWPFWRLAGMQEPAAVAFSLANLLMHVLGVDWLRRGVHPAHPMRPFYLTWAYASINAWVWSAVFHTRDTPLTEKLDYFSAALAILYALYMTVVRLLHLYPGTPAFPGRPERRAFLYVWRALAVVAYIGHVSYLALAPRFDYTYNIVFNVVLGLVHHAMWVQFAVPGSSPLNRYAAMPGSYPALTVALTTAATALELFDFQPWGRVLDAHALWHLATAPLAVLWYDFLLRDAQDAGWRGRRL
ncbi:Per1-like protein [Russula earlei]|uniref:Per1-like protein n=1 Tax=Russula earlei TaxID=71964 RepID=A0ACC0UB32_9AGAM|nr:Per1-like protein [Russula earlei]